MDLEKKRMCKLIAEIVRLTVKDVVKWAVRTDATFEGLARLYLQLRFNVTKHDDVRMAIIKLKGIQ